MGHSTPDTSTATKHLDLDRVLSATLADGQGDRRPALALLTGLWRATAPDHAGRIAELDAACALLCDRIGSAHDQHLADPLDVVIWVGTRLGPAAAYQVRPMTTADPDRLPEGPLRVPCLVWYTAGMVATGGRGALSWWHRLGDRVPREPRGAADDVPAAGR